MDNSISRLSVLIKLLTLPIFSVFLWIYREIQLMELYTNGFKSPPSTCLGEHLQINPNLILDK